MPPRFHGVFAAQSLLFRPVELPQLEACGSNVERAANHHRLAANASIPSIGSASDHESVRTPRITDFWIAISGLPPASTLRGMPPASRPADGPHTRPAPREPLAIACGMFSMHAAATSMLTCIQH